MHARRQSQIQIVHSNPFKLVTIGFYSTTLYLFPKMPQKKRRYLSTLFKIINVAEYYIYGFDRFWMTVNNQLTHTISQSDSKKNFLTK